ncbi:hypothetical protein [Streptomyces kebangsaanensis]|nr:hypothetical protein [Streptomyces kebangsaanensis]
MTSVPYVSRNWAYSVSVAASAVVISAAIEFKIPLRRHDGDPLEDHQ